MEAFLMLGVLTVLALWVYDISDHCRHSYERVDTCNDKKMVLICRKCGKIKKLRK